MAAARCFLGLLVVVAACADDPDVCLTKSTTISSGVFGVIRHDCELGGGCDATHLGRPVPNVHVGLFAPGFKPAEGDPAIVDTRSAYDGFYQLSVPAGTYNLCWISSFAGNSHCLTVTTEALAVRYDYIPDMVTGENWKNLECE